MRGGLEQEQHILFMKKKIFRELDQEKQDEKSLLLWEEEFHEE